MSRLLNGNFIFLDDLTDNGQLDERYLRYTNPPANQNSIGFAGQVSWDNINFYVCIAGDGTFGVWKATPLVSEWSN